MHTCEHDQLTTHVHNARTLAHTCTHHTWTHMHTCAHMGTTVHTYGHICTQIYACPPMSACAQMNTRAHMYASVRTHAHKSTRTCTRARWCCARHGSRYRAAARPRYWARVARLLISAAAGPLPSRSLSRGPLVACSFMLNRPVVAPRRRVVPAAGDVVRPMPESERERPDPPVRAARPLEPLAGDRAPRREKRPPAGEPSEPRC